MQKNKSNRIRPDYSIRIMAYVSFAAFAVFFIVPVWGWIIAFIDYNPGISIFKSPFVGLKHFQRIYSNSMEFLRVMRNTIAMSFLRLAMTPIAGVLAILITEVPFKRFKKVVQTASVFPYLVSWVVIYSVFFAILSVDDGMLNNLLLNLGIISKPFDLLANEKATWPFMTFVSSWWNTGYYAMVYIAVISSINPELYEAAAIDGAGRFKMALHITVPSLVPMFVIMFVLQCGQILSFGFEQYFTFGNPLTRSSIEVFPTYAYRLGIANFRYSLSTAVGIFQSVVSIILLTFSNWLAGKLYGRKLLS